jgi:cold shock protein
MAGFRVGTTVAWWDDALGWGALADSEETPGGAFVHFSVIEMEGFRTLRPGQTVEAVVQEGGQDGYDYSAILVRPLGKADELPDWTVTVEEISAGVYRVEGHDGGRSVSVTGDDPEKLLQEAHERLAQIAGSLPAQPDQAK